MRSRRCRLRVLCLFLLCLVPGSVPVQIAPVTIVSAQTAAAQIIDPSPRLIVPFENLRKDPRLHWLGEGSAVLLTDDVLALGGRATTREGRLRAFERMNVPVVATLTHATIIRLGELVGATQAVIGSFEVVDGLLSVRARAIRLDTGRLLPEIAERGAIEDAFAVYARVARRLVPGSKVDPAQIAQGYPPIIAFEQYIKGLVAVSPAAQLSCLDQALKLFPAFHRVHLARWDVYDQRGEHEAALAAARQVPDGTPLSRRAQFKAALSLISLARNDEAFAALTILNRVKRDPAVLNDLAIVQLRRGPSGGASPVSLFMDASALDPDDADLFFNAGYASWLGRETQPAIAALREAVRRNPADDEAHYVLGVALQSAGSTTESAREKELAMRLSSTFAEWEAKQPGQPVPKGLERLKTDIDVPGSLRVESALVASGQREQRELATFHLDRGRRLFEQEHDAEAVAELRRAVYLAPYESEAHLLLGRSYLRTGRVKEAVDALKISIWSDDTPAARLALAGAYLQSKQPADARAEIDVVLKREPTNGEARRLLSLLP